MSRYLVDRIEGLANIEVVTRRAGQRRSKAATACWKRSAGGSRATGEEVRRPMRHLFLFIGADPNTDWLAGSGVALDAKGFVLTGRGCRRATAMPLETSRRGVFAIGDVRAKSVKRVAAAVGEGAQVVAALHAFLARDRPPWRCYGDHPGGASSKPLKSKPGATVQPHSVQSPRLCAACQA